MNAISWNDLTYKVLGRSVSPSTEYYYGHFSSLGQSCSNLVGLVRVFESMEDFPEITI
jgi:hypothetical protein